MSETRGVLWVVEAREPGGRWQWATTGIYATKAPAVAKMRRLLNIIAADGVEYRVVRYVRKED